MNLSKRTVHALKVKRDFFDPIASGLKTFEARKEDDRRFAAGDLLQLREWDDAGGYSGRALLVEVLYILRGRPWLAAHFACLAIRLIRCAHEWPQVENASGFCNRCGAPTCPSCHAGCDRPAT